MDFLLNLDILGFLTSWWWLWLVLAGISFLFGRSGFFFVILAVCCFILALIAVSWMLLGIAWLYFNWDIAMTVISNFFTLKRFSILDIIRIVITGIVWVIYGFFAIGIVLFVVLLIFALVSIR